MKKIKRMFLRIANLVVHNKVKILLWKSCVRWPFFADCYYALTGSFRREHRAVLLGKLQHIEDIAKTGREGREYTLRRNTHRLEKGIIMRPRRSVFARDYIGETVDIFLELNNSPESAHLPLVTWSRDVLNEYFSLIGRDSAIEPYRVKFTSQPKIQSVELTDTKVIPYLRDTEPLQVKIEDLEELAWRRRSVRWFINKPVPREIIDRAVEVAKLSPSACNRQPFSFRIFDEPNLVKKVAEIPLGTKGFSHQFQCVIVIVGDLSAYSKERDRHVIYVDGGLAAMALQFALEAQGISSCCINWPDIESCEKSMDKALGLTNNLRPIMCMAIGYADPTGLVPYSQKKSLNSMRSYNNEC